MPSSVTRNLVAVLLVAGGLASSVVADTFGSAPEPPPPAKNYRPPSSPPSAPRPTADESAIPEPEVVITKRGEDRIEEYRVGGYLYMIKVTPKKGPPYYLVDRMGNGQFIRSDLVPDFRPPMWIIKKF